MTGSEAARYYQVSRRTLYRWHAEGRLMVWEWGTKHERPRPRGPRRNPQSKRYTMGRHRFGKAS